MPGPDDSCTQVMLQAMVDAMTYLESPQGFGSTDPDARRYRVGARSGGPATDPAITVKRILPDVGGGSRRVSR